jgi:hypothetical protein
MIRFIITTFNAEYVTIDEMRRNFFDSKIIEGTYVQTQSRFVYKSF